MDDCFRVDERLRVGREQPSEEDLRALAAAGVRAVLDLRRAGEGEQALPPEAEAKAARRSGLEYENLPIPADRLEDAMIDEFRDAVAALPHPVFVHCASGKRSGVLALIDAAIAADQSGAAMLGRGVATGVLYGSPDMLETARRYVDRLAGGKSALLPPTARRVERNTPAAVNRRLHAETEGNLRYFAEHPEAIPQRLEALDREWDIERALETNAAALALTGVLLGAFIDRRFLILPALVTGFLLQHALQGWCPPVPFFRKRGVRTAAEIERERCALKALRGDFRGRGPITPARALEAATA